MSVSVLLESPLLGFILKSPSMTRGSVDPSGLLSTRVSLGTTLESRTYRTGGVPDSPRTSMDVLRLHQTRHVEREELVEEELSPVQGEVHEGDGPHEDDVQTQVGTLEVDCPGSSKSHSLSSGASSHVPSSPPTRMVQTSDVHEEFLWSLEEEVVGAKDLYPMRQHLQTKFGKLVAKVQSEDVSLCKGRPRHPTRATSPPPTSVSNYRVFPFSLRSRP